MPRLVTFALAIGLQAFAGFALAGPSATELMQQGDKHWEANQLDQAMESFVAAEQADPNSVEVLMKKAGLQMATLHYSDAVDTYQKALGLNPKNAKAFIGMGICYLHNGATALAKAAFEEAIKVEPERRAQLEPALANIDERLQREAIQQMEDFHTGKTGPDAKTNPHGGQ